MTQVYIADAQVMERSAFRLLLKELKMSVTGEAGDWATALADVPVKRPEMVIVEWDILPSHSAADLAKLREVSSQTMIIILVYNFLSIAKRSELSPQVDIFMSKLDSPQKISQLIQTAAEMNARSKEMIRSN
jgi:DNA-binding NarL/FixJ family response regulator